MKTLLTVLIVIMGSISCAQTNITTESQKAIIDKLSIEVTKRYFNRDIAKSIADTLGIIKTQIKNENTIDYFTDIINSTLHKKSNDNHLKIYFDEEKFNSYSIDEKSRREFEYQSHKKVNFGFTKVDVLEGNIGYIEIIKFSEFIGEETANKIASAMNLVESTNALIIDLRNNGGGDGRVGEILETYFYPEENEVYYDSVQNVEKFKVLPFVLGKRYLNRPVYILTGWGTFSAAEGFANRMQKNKKAIIIGKKTKGGGSSGSSVPIVNNFLCFIPTSSGLSDNNASVKPDFTAEEKNTLNYAKYLIYKDELNKNTNEFDKEITHWNIKTNEYLLMLNDQKFSLNKNFIGNYESNRKVFVKTEQLYLSIKNETYKLVQIDENEFILEGFEDTFGTGNRRIIFNDNGFVDRIYTGGILMSKTFRKE
jgi:hypothetical protein